jgi:2-oxoglutarate dehydrogenase E2 component (dihydrolipoamide succinyltransferase)
MPQLGETVTEGTITKWFKAVGDTVVRDEPLFEVSTDKVDSEVPSPADGILTAILVEEGDTVDVGVALAVIDGAGPGAAPAPVADSAPPPPPPAPDVTPPSAAPLTALPDEPVPGAPRTPDSAAPPGPAAPVVTPAPTAPPAPVVTPAPTAPVPAGAVPPGAVDQSQVLSPVVRRLLADHGLDPASIHGTGLGGRITRADVEAVIEQGALPSTVPTVPSAPVPPGSPGPAAAPTAAAAERPAGERDEVVPFTNIRRRTAEHMVRSKATSAHTLMVKEIDYERVEQVRRAHGERFRDEEGFTLTYLPFVARATVEALAEYPHLNASVGEDALVVHHDINLGIAVDLDNEGLIVPVVHRAEELNLRGMARRIRDVADRARTKRLSLDDISGGTFSITNAGPFGTLITGAIINQPQVAILSTDGVSRKPVVVVLPDGTESIGIHSMGLVAMNFDHRAVDGAYVARFLARVSDILNDRDWAGELAFRP